MIYCAELTNRGILKVSGTDRLAFLQGLVTNDVRLLTSQISLYSLLLTPQGKHSFDLFLSEVKGEWWIEADRARLEELEKRLSLRKLRSRVVFEIDETQHVFALWGKDVTGTFDLQDILGQTQHPPFGYAYTDPRLLELGIRMVMTSENIPHLLKHEQLIQVGIPEYQYHRYGLGVPESDAELGIDKSIPLENGMDDLKAINWQKGCYMGQELTARTRYRGLVRKRLFPVVFEGEVDSQMPILADQKEVGTWRGVSRDRGLILLRLEALNKPLVCGTTPLKIVLPNWITLPKDL